jgi:hypothetical protein
MKLNRIIIAALAAATLFSAAPARAAQVQMCGPDVAGGVQGPRTITNPNTTTTYVVGSFGCTLVGLADIGYFQSQGWQQSGPLYALVFNTGVATGTTDFVVGTLPAGTYIREVMVTNSVAAAVTGNISFGTTANGTDVVASLACGSTCLAFTTDANLAKRMFSLTASQQIHAAAITAWNSTNCTITIVYGYF